MYEYTLKLHQPRPIAQREGAGAASNSSFDPPASTALEEQLGLRVEPAKVPIETIVIEHVEKPSEN